MLRRALITLAAVSLLAIGGSAPVQAGPNPPKPAAAAAVKGHPSIRTPQARLLTCSPACYFYNKGSQGFASAPYPTGFYASFTIANPAIAADGYHSLGEISVEMTIGGQRQIVEAGWRKASGDVTRFFVGHWVAGAWQGYNAGFTDYAGTAPNAGDALTTGVNRKFGIVYSGSSWWIWEGPVSGAGGDWVGYFPGTNWTGAGVSGFDHSTFSQAFLEVASSSAAPCTDMGDGSHGSATTGALVGSSTNVGGPTSSLTIGETPAYAGYTEYALSSRTFRGGGPGC